MTCTIGPVKPFRFCNDEYSTILKSRKRLTSHRSYEKADFTSSEDSFVLKLPQSLTRRHRKFTEYCNDILELLLNPFAALVFRGMGLVLLVFLIYSSWLILWNEAGELKPLNLILPVVCLLAIPFLFYYAVCSLVALLFDCCGVTEIRLDRKGVQVNKRVFFWSRQVEFFPMEEIKYFYCDYAPRYHIDCSTPRLYFVIAVKGKNISSEQIHRERERVRANLFLLGSKTEKSSAFLDFAAETGNCLLEVLARKS